MIYLHAIRHGSSVIIQSRHSKYSRDVDSLLTTAILQEKFFIYPNILPIFAPEICCHVPSGMSNGCLLSSATTSDCYLHNCPPPSPWQLLCDPVLFVLLEPLIWTATCSLWDTYRILPPKPNSDILSFPCQQWELPSEDRPFLAVQISKSLLFHSIGTPSKHGCKLAGHVCIEVYSCCSQWESAFMFDCAYTTC